jgi:crossover junction endodeoxyribonuclease RusA
MNIILPYPPSCNRYWRHNRGRTHRSKEAVDYINHVGNLCVVHKVRPTAESVCVTLRVFRPAKRGDLDNTAKVLLDALRGYAYLDDKQIVELHSYRHDDKSAPRVEVSVQEVK